MYLQTPRKLTPLVVEFCHAIAPSEKPVYLPHTKTRGTLPGECFDNVDSVVNERGGNRLLGWMIWEWLDVMIEAEFHAVWKDEHGRLIDVTPRPTGDAQVLFLPDPKGSYEGITPKNIRKAVSGDCLAQDFVTFADLADDLDRANRRPYEKVLDFQSEEDCMMYSTAAHMKNQLGLLLVQGQSDSIQCYCSSGRSYKECCALRNTFATT